MLSIQQKPLRKAKKTRPLKTRETAGYDYSYASEGKYYRGPGLAVS